MLMDFTLIPIDEAHFPDAGFRQFVADNYDTNGDLLLNGWERSRVRTMRLQSREGDLDWQIHFPAYCTSLEGIQYFTELNEISFGHIYGVMARIDLSQNTKLTRAELWFVGPDGVDVSGCAGLRDLRILGGGFITELDVSGCPALENLELGHWAGALAGERLHGHYYFEGGNEFLTALDLSHNPALKSLTVDTCYNMTSLDLSNHPALEEAFLRGCGLTSLNVNGCPALTTLNVSYNLFDELDVTMCPRIRGVNVEGMPGIVLNVSHKYANYLKPESTRVEVWTYLSHPATVYYADTTYFEYISSISGEWVSEWTGY